MDIKVMVAAHKPYWMPTDDVYLPVQVGAAGKESIDAAWQRDDEGENISSLNPYYCELTALYWAWKNLEADYIGLVHYRRYFTRKEAHSIEGKRKQILTGPEWEKLLLDAAVVVADKRKYYIETNSSHYFHAHQPEGMEETEKLIHELYPDYEDAMRLVMNRTWAHMFNMFVMRRDLYAAYCEWMFGILFELERRLDTAGWSSYEARVYGFVSELLLDVWLERHHISYREQNVSFMERQNWLKKGGNFLLRKLRLSGRQK